MKEQISYDIFDKVDIRIGTVLSVKKNIKARKPSLIIEVDFGDEIGIKQSSAQITDFYNEENLKGKQVIGGWVADEVYEVYPKAVHGEPGQMMDVKDDNGKKTGEEVINPMGVSSAEFISVMMKAIQELSAKVEALEKAK